MAEHIHYADQWRSGRAGLLWRPERGLRWSHDVEPAEWDRDRHPNRRISPPTGPWLIHREEPGSKANQAFSIRRYPPFTDPRCVDVHRKFAQLATVPLNKQSEAIRRFASQFGFLGSRRELVTLGQRGRANVFHVVPVYLGENQHYWRSEVSELAALLALWDHVKKGERGEVAKYVLASRGRVEVFIAWDNGSLTTNRSYEVDWRVTTWQGSDPHAEIVAGKGGRLGEYRELIFPQLQGRRPDVLLAAKLFLFDHANDKLWGRISPQLWAEAPKGEELSLYPHSLLGLVWLRFVDEMLGTTAAGIACANPRCRAAFVPTRRNHRYCRQACRQQALHSRNRNAADAGLTPTRTPTAGDGDGQTGTSEDAISFT